jgi:sugar lactone lactonase YvrE
MTMKITIALAVLAGCVAATASAQKPSSAFDRGHSQQSWQNPGLAAAVAKCKTPPAPSPIRAGQASQANDGPPPEPAMPGPTSEIPGVIAAGQTWKVVWSWEGNNVDGPIAGDAGTMIFANNDASNVMQVDPSTGLAKILFSDTNTGGAVSRSKNGTLYLASRGLPAAILELEPQRKVFANMVNGEPLDCAGGVLNDLSADAHGGVYLSVSGTVVVAFDVQPDGSLKNQREFGKLQGGRGGDGSAVDQQGRLYVATGESADVFSPSGEFLGSIKGPQGMHGVAFGGKDRKTLFGIVFYGGWGTPSARNKLIGIPTIAQGYTGRAK